MIGYIFLPERPITFRRIAIFTLIISGCFALTYFLSEPDPIVLPEQQKILPEPMVYEAVKVGNEIYRIIK